MVAMNFPSARSPSEAMTFLPLRAPREMPTQKLNEAPDHPSRTGNSPAHAARRLLMLSTTIALTALAAYEMYYVLEVGGITVAEATVLVLFVALFAWIAFSSFSAIAGFFVLLFSRPPAPAHHNMRLSSRTALLFPVYNEDPAPVLRRVRAMHEAIAAAGFERHFDVFILSDTTDPDIWVLEEKLLLDLRRDNGFANIFYRHRAKNVARKSGNIQDWICAFGGGYDSMIILDADSLMTAESVVQLAAAMERSPDAALIQTLPVIVNAQSLFARLQQFAGRLYGPVIAAGIAWWHGSESNYWGHNAIIRINAFAAHAGLPELRGRKPFGGHVLSHDFVEAALMRRSGWGIYMAHQIRGSYEECPPTPLDYAARDRRWCQGNLQHIALLGTRGLHWLSRLHLLTGIGSYLTAPMWLAFLLLGIAISLQAQFVRPEYFPSGFSLFPKWPAQDPIRAMWVFGGTMALLLIPKLLAFLLVLADGRRRRAFGGAALVGSGIVVEIVLSGLLAPAMMVFQSVAVVDILLGRDSGWQVQSRAGGAVAMQLVLRRFAIPTALGVAMAISAWMVSLSLFLWMTPVIIGLLVAIPLAALLSRPSGAASGRRRLLATPEELSPSPLLVAAAHTDTPGPREQVDAFELLRNDPALRQAHFANLPTGSSRRRGEIEERLVVATAKIDDAESFTEAASFLTRQEKLAVLGSDAALRKLLSKQAMPSA
jgi:membrane glycosyltransferase